MSVGTGKFVFKIGLVQDGKLISESVLKEKQSVTIGTDSANTFAVTEKDMPRRHVMLEETAQGFRLNPLPSMQGMVIGEGGAKDLTAIVAEQGASSSIPLGSSGKGKIQIGNSTLLFQVLPAPPPPPMTKLPPEMKGGYFHRLDAPFFIVVVISALFHIGMVNYINSMPVQESMPAEDIDALVVLVTEDVIESLEEPALEDKALDEKKEEGGGAKKGGGGGGPKGEGGGGEEEAKGVETKGLLGLITAEGGAGSIADIISDTGTGSGLDDALNKIGGGVDVASEGSGLAGGSRGGGGDGIVGVSAGGMGRISAGSKSGGGTGEKTEKTVKAQVSSSGGSSGSLDSGSVSATIRRYVGGVRNCYERQLKIDPTLSGTVRVAFTIGGDGSVQGCSVTSSTISSSEVGSCVCSRVQRWRFTAAEDGGSSSVNYSFIFTPASN